MTSADKPKRQKRSRALIKENLRKVYQETEEQEIPESLKDLLERLKRSDEEGENRK